MEIEIRDITVMSPHELAEYKKYLSSATDWHEESGSGNQIDLSNAMYILDKIEDMLCNITKYEMELFTKHQASKFNSEV